MEEGKKGSGGKGGAVDEVGVPYDRLVCTWSIASMP